MAACYNKLWKTCNRYSERNLMERLRHLGDKWFNRLSLVLYKLGGVKVIKTNDFPNAKKKVKKLAPILDQYFFDDIAKAVFCICVCVNNRSVLESTLALNWALAQHKHAGKKRLETYGDFIEFYNSIKNIMQASVYDDAVVEDYGDVSIEVYGKKYSVVIGTGHNMVFACLQFLPYLASDIEKEEELTKVLSYNSYIIDFLREANVTDGNHGARFILPNESLFHKVKELFANLDIETMKEIASLVDSDLIEKKHFITTEGRIMPLANASILLDLYDKWYKTISADEKVQFINNSLSRVAVSLSKLEMDERVNYMCPVAYSHNSEVPTPIKKFPFALVSSKGIIIAVNKSEYSKEELNNTINDILKAKNNNSLYLVELLSRNNNGKSRGITALKDSEVKFIIYDAWANPEETHAVRRSRDEVHHYCSALDIVYYLLFMGDADELFEYLQYSEEKSDAHIFGFGGDASTFLMWKDANHMFEKGAIKYSFIDVGFDTENDYVVDYYRNKLKDFPIGFGDYILDNPFAWNITPKENRFYEYVQKGKAGFGGLFRSFENDCYFFFPHNVQFYPDIKEYSKYKGIIFMIEDMIQRMLISSKDIICSCTELRFCSVQLMMMPESYAKKSDPSGTLLLQERKYVKSDSIISNNKICIRFVPLVDKLFGDISEAKDRTVEVEFFLELMQPMSKYFPGFYVSLQEHLEIIKSEKKEVSAISYKIDYVWNQEQESVFRVKDGAYLAVRKHIAEVCLNAGISTGTHYGKDATAVVRKIQKELIEDFEAEVKKYDYLKLQERVLADYATLLHEIMIHRRRYDGFDDIKDAVKVEVSQNIINQREEAKHNARTASYLLETALFNREKGKAILSNEKYQYLLAYANWLVVLSDNADMCYFTEEEVFVEVTGEYLIDVEANREPEHKLGSELAKRMYDHPGHFERDKDADNTYFEKVKQAFESDTSVPLEVFLAFVYYLETGGKVDNEIFWKGNVLCFWKDDLIDDFISIQKCSRKLAEKALDMICIDPNKLKTKNGKSDFYLPIGEKEKRCDRYEVKPAYEYEGMVIYAPSSMHYLRDYWQNSLFEFCMPFEIGLQNTKDVLVEWKRVYEKKIVFDLEKVFKNRGFVVRPNFELMNLDKNIYPQYLGDYDVFAVNLEKREIWIIECKVIEKVETFYEMYRQQNRFFKENKFDEKFQRRIDFMNEHYSEVIRDLNLPEAEYQIKPYMCVNKVFASRYKDIAFPILCYQEMVEEIEQE